eukprot:1962118-Rhodomonas_salina.2
MALVRNSEKGSSSSSPLKASAGCHWQERSSVEPPVTGCLPVWAEFGTQPQWHIVLGTQSRLPVTRSVRGAGHSVRPWLALQVGPSDWLAVTVPWLRLGLRACQPEWVRIFEAWKQDWDSVSRLAADVPRRDLASLPSTRGFLLAPLDQCLSSSLCACDATIRKQRRAGTQIPSEITAVVY